jgi:exodeoxyribonuclease V alpha subunit
MKNNTKVSGTIEKVFYANPDFSAGKLRRSADGQLVVFAGKLYAKEGQRIVLFGNWKEHDKYGRQFHVKYIEHDLDLDANGLVNYLAKHPDIKGIGPVKARRLVDAFGDNFEKTLLNNPEKFAKAGKVSMDAVKLLQNEWQLKRNTNAVRAWLSSFELTHHQVTTLVEKLGNNCLDVLKADPYILIREIKNFGFKKVDRIARKMGTPKGHPSRIKAGIKFCIDEALDAGDCYVEFEELLDRANALLIMDNLGSREKIETHLDTLLDENILSCQSEGGRILVADPGILKMETELAEIFMNAGKSKPHFSFSTGRSIMQLSSKLNKKQRQAVENAICQRMSLISGGAGTGKTYLVSKIVRIADKAGKKIILAAPTGKAAKRLEEVVNIPAMTIHRMLGYDGNDFSVEKIDADILIVDETSMIPVPLAWQLFKSINLDKTSVVLVGDHNQLPPVGPGNILRDLIQSRVIPTTILKEVMRQAGALKENSMAVLNGEVRATSAPNENRCRDWYLVNKYTNPADAKKFLCKLVEEQLQGFGFDLVRDVQILTPTHKGPLGTRELNITLQSIIQKKCNGIHVPPVAPNRRPPFLLHDKVIQTRNNYETGIMNGTIGFITDVDPRGNLTVDFEGEAVEIEKGSGGMRDIQLAYVLTTHRAQGSEFPCAVLIVHKSHSFMHHRNLFYTGVTRAQKTAIIIGDTWGIRNCAQKKQVSERKTFLSHLLPVKSGGIYA